MQTVIRLTIFILNVCTFVHYLRYVLSAEDEKSFINELTLENTDLIYRYYSLNWFHLQTVLMFYFCTSPCILAEDSMNLTVSSNSIFSSEYDFFMQQWFSKMASNKKYTFMVTKSIIEIFHNSNIIDYENVRKYAMFSERRRSIF